MQALTRSIRAAARCVQRAYSPDGDQWPKSAGGWRLDISVTPGSEHVAVYISLAPVEVPWWLTTPKPSSDWMRSVWVQGVPAPTDIPMLATGTAVPRLSAVFSEEDDGSLVATVMGLQVGHDLANDESHQEVLERVRRVYRANPGASEHVARVLDETREGARPAVEAAAQALGQRRLSSFLMSVLVDIAIRTGASAIELDDSSSQPGIYGRMLGESPRFRQDEEDECAWRLSLVGPGADSIVPRLLARVEAAARPGVLAWEPARKRSRRV